MKKLFSLIIFTAAALMSTASSAADDNTFDGFSFSGSVALTNDYLFYGYSQSNQGWAVQGGLTLNHESGFYLGTWASVVDFGPFGPNSRTPGGLNPANIELDISGGYAGEFSNGLSYDFGAVRYGYPDQNQDSGGGSFEYWEGYASFSYTFDSEYSPTVDFGINVSPDWFGESGTSYYPHGGLSVSLPQGFGAYVNAGYLDVSDINYSYAHYQIGVTKDFGGLSFNLGYANADKECDGGNSLCEGFIFSVSKDF